MITPLRFPLPTLLLLATLASLTSALWEAKVTAVSGSQTTREYQLHHLAVHTIQLHNEMCERQRIPPEYRFELFAKEWANVTRDFRMTAQQIVGAVPVLEAVDVLLSEMWWVYGYVPVRNADIRQALLPLVPVTQHWVDPYGGTGYFGMQLYRTLGVSIESWDRKPRHMQWVRMRAQNASDADYTKYDTFVLGYPCCIPDCWGAVPKFTELDNSKYLIFLGEPRGHYCASDDMWDYICAHWDLRIAHRIRGGLPGSYHHLFVFTKKGTEDTCRQFCANGDMTCECPVKSCFETTIIE